MNSSRLFMLLLALQLFTNFLQPVH